MRLQKWQKFVSIIICMVLIMGMNGVQTLATSDNFVYAEELGSGESAGEEISSESTEESYMEIPADTDSSSIVMDFGAEDILAGGIIEDDGGIIEETPAPEEEIPMQVKAEVTEVPDSDGAENTDRRWVKVQALDSSEAQTGSSTVKIYFEDTQTKEPADNFQAAVAKNQQELLENLDFLTPAALKNALSTGDELTINQVRKETETYLEFLLPAGSQAEFFLALTCSNEEENQITVYADAWQSVGETETSVLTEECRDKKVNLVWETAQVDPEENPTTEEEPTDPEEAPIEEEPTSQEEAPTEEPTDPEKNPTEEEEPTDPEENPTEEEEPTDSEENPTEEEEPTDLEENPTAEDEPTDSETLSEDAEMKEPEISSVRISMVKELDDPEIASDSEEETTSDSQEETAAAAAASGQTYIVHVQAEDLHPEAEYSSTVTFEMTDFATGLPAGDVKTTAAATKEEIQAFGLNEENSYTIPDAVQVLGDTQDLTITRVQETTMSEEGTETLTSDSLQFILPAGGSADFYLGFTYETDEASYQKQLMVEAKAVSYIPTIYTEQVETQESSDQSTDSESDFQLETASEPESDSEPDGEILSDQTTTSDTWESEVMPASEMIMVGMSALSDVVSDPVGEEPSADEAAGSENPSQTEPTADSAATNTNNNSTTEDTEEIIENDTEETLVAIDVLETSIAPMMMLWSAAVSERTVYFDTCGNGGWNGWNIDSTIYIYPIGIGASGPQVMTKSDKKNTLHNCEGVLWEYTITSSTCTGVVFVNQDSWGSDESVQTVDVSFSDSKWNTVVAPCFKLDGGNSGAKKTVECIGDLTPISQAGNFIYFVNMDIDTELSSVTAVFSGDGLTESQTSMSQENGIWKVEIPKDADTEAYSTVQFKDADGKVLGDKYNFLDEPLDGEIGVAYDADTLNTFYYAATEKSDGTLISTWGVCPEGTESIGNKILYFNNLHFPVKADSEVYIQIADGSEEALTADSNDENTYSYAVPADSSAAQNTILTVIVSGTEYHFLWSNLTNNLLELNSEIAEVSGTYAKKNYVYFDATMSKLSYAGTCTDNSLPKSGMELWYHAWNNGETPHDGKMELLPAYSDGKNTWEDVYCGELDKEYDNILFTVGNESNISWIGCSSQTVNLELPDNITNPCFYADTSDDSIYDAANRSGYWDEVYTIRDAEAKKENKDVVDIQSSSFTKENNILYVDSTFYDYYTDYELNGNNRDSYGGTNEASYRNWVNFRQFNQALSDYYEKADADIPLYTGQFQPSFWNYPFSQIADTLNLYGYSNTNNFFSTNNSAINIDGTRGFYNYAAQGLVNSELTNGLPTAKGTTAILPYFNECFITGSNSKNAVLGEVYHNVSFPFEKVDIEDDGEDGVEYWYFNSAKTTLAMREDTGGTGYYLANTGNQGWSQNVNSSGTTGGADSVSEIYGFFPFNETASAASGKNYNYGFGTKLEFTFRLTETGTVNDKNENSVPIKFRFSGDDDVWVFIDGELVLDVGGDHGEVTGVIDFSNRTATVNRVKASAGSSTAGLDVKNNFNISGYDASTEKYDTTEHTLTMFYMERGMWESNMEISFNFPDENQLEVEKQVDKTNVNDLFKEVFDDASLFTFSIKNLATHYGTQATAAESIPSEAFTVTGTESPGGNICEKITWEGEDAVHWWAALEDKTSAYREKRYGTIKGDAVDISQMKYLQFSFYYAYTDDPSFSNMYLQLVDSSGKKMGNISTDSLAGKTYGTISLSGGKWITIKLDLDKFSEEEGFDKGKVTAIRFGYNYPRNIYLKDFTFHSAVEPPTDVGFITKQYDIPDYGSATSGNLEIPVGAYYESSDGKNYAIGEDGTFVLMNQETATFRDQFRRGSYIYLKEEVDTNLFDTTWTMYENGKAVTSMSNGEYITNGSISSLSGTNSTVVEDGRTEKLVDDTVDGKATKNAYNGTKPSDSTFVFRSYSNPDNTTGTTKLKVVFENSVKTGSLTIKKEAAYPTDVLDGTYEFTVTFTNVGGLALEEEEIVTKVSLIAGESTTISGIPLGTVCEIEESASSDGSSLEEVNVTGTDSYLVDSETKIVKCRIDEEDAEVTATFKNTKKPLIDLSLEKLWKNADGSDYSGTLPEQIGVQLQRKKATEADADYQVVPGYGYVEVKAGYDGWLHQFTGLDQYVDYTQEEKTNWIYRVVELDSTGNPVENGGVIGDFVVTGQLQTENDETGDLQYVLTNTYHSSVNLMLKKVKASDHTQMLNDATFKLERLKQSSSGTISIGDDLYEVDSEFEAIEKTTAGTEAEDSDEEIPLGQIDFGNLETGIYRLTETKAPAGYSLLKSPILIELHADGSCTEAGTDQSIGTVTQDSGTKVITITVANQAKFEIPATGSWSRYIISFAGVMVAGAAMILYLLQKRRKGERAS